MSKLTQAARVCFDLFILAVLCFTEYAIHKWLEPNKRGFFCDDESLQYPFRESSISMLALLVIVFPVPCLVIVAVELFRHLPATAAVGAGANASDGRRNKSQVTSVTTSGFRLGHRLVQCYKQLGFYIFGLGLTLIATEIGKYALGRLRPNFFAICQPQLPDGSTCADAVNQGRYVEDYTCTNPNFSARQHRETRFSFPSGHASTTFFAMVYLAVYLQTMLSTRISKLLKHLLQFSAIMLAWYVALMRVSDYWHHWSDVLAGALCGVIFAYILARFVVELLPRSRTASADGGRSAGQVKPSSTSLASSGAKSATANAAVLPAYTFGTLPYLHYPPTHQYGAQTYHNYGYVP